MLLAHKVELRSSVEQICVLNQWTGTSRHCYNNLLNHFKKPEVKFSKKEAREFLYNSLRKEFEWYGAVSQSMLQSTIDDLDCAYKRFFEKIGGYPQFKNKHKKKSFSIRNVKKIRVDRRNLYFEKFNIKKSKPIKMREALRFGGVVKQLTISNENGKWFGSFLIESTDYKGNFNQENESVGVDLGIKNLATLSNGVEFPKSNKLSLNLNKLAKLQRKLSKKKKSSNRYAKAKLSISKLHFKIKNQRSSLLHQVSHYLTSNYKTICLEDLSVSSMVSGDKRFKNKVKSNKLNRMILDVGMYELRRQIEYKAFWRDVRVHFVDRYFPSSKLCNHCGYKNDHLKLGQSSWRCIGCNQTNDRDLNAARNILAEGLRLAKV